MSDAGSYDAGSYKELFGALLQTAIAAGAAIMQIYRSDFDVSLKGDDTPVTEADRRAEDIILADLDRLAGDIAVIAEEQVTRDGLPEVGKRFFLVDPLDGTREFIRRSEDFTVNIALAEAGRAVAGLIYAPARGRMFYVFPGAPARELSVRQGRIDWNSERRLATAAPDPAAWRVVTSRSHRDGRTDRYLSCLPISASCTAGSSLKFCLLAAGEADLYPRIGTTMEWDTAAGQAILEAAGGCVTTFDGSPLTYAKRDRGFANPSFIAWGQRPDEDVFAQLARIPPP